MATSTRTYYETETVITFLDTYINKGEIFKTESILDLHTYTDLKKTKPKEIFQYTRYFLSRRRPRVKKEFIKGGTLNRLLNQNTSEKTDLKMMSTIQSNLS